MAHISRQLRNGYTPSNLPDRNRSPDTLVCFGLTENGEKSRADFRHDTDMIAAGIRTKRFSRWVILCEDRYLFLAAFTAVLQCGKEAVLGAGVPDAYVKTNDTGFLTDSDCTEHENSSLNAETGKNEAQTGTAGSVITIYTTDSMEKPDPVTKYPYEFEAETEKLILQWGPFFSGRKVYSTVSHHHIYGLFFSVLLPFTMGIPFSRDRIEFPDQIRYAGYAPSVIISSPAFLGNMIKSRLPQNMFADTPVFFSSEGRLPLQTAERTAYVCGHWPIEIYCGTETGSVAYRQSKNGPGWTPFRTDRIMRTSEGKMNVHSPFTGSPEGITTSDLIELCEGGSFLLEGRTDLIEETEGKQVPPTAAELRILSSGLVEDACIILLPGKRQRFAAAVVLNDTGKYKFAGAHKGHIDMFFHFYLKSFPETAVLPEKWRYADTLPRDTLGNPEWNEIRKLFAGRTEKKHEIPVPESALSGRTKVTAGFSVPRDSGYFNSRRGKSPALPAAAQVGIAVRFSSRYLSAAPETGKTPCLRSRRPIPPDVRIMLELLCDEEKRKVTFRFIDPETKSVYSEGSFRTSARRS